jgi:hypothetical protein
MRVLVALAAVALVGLAIGAHSAAAGSKKPGVSISVDLGPASVKVDASSGGADASSDVSTPAATVDATIDSSAQTPVSAAVDTSTPAADATVDVADSSAATVSTPTGATTVRADTTKGVEASVKSSIASGKAAVSASTAHADTKVSTPTGSAGTAVHAASVGASKEGSPAVALPVRAPGAAKPAKPQAVGRSTVRRTRPAAAQPAHIPLVTAVPWNAEVAGRTGSTQPPGLTGVLAGSSRPGAGHAPDAAPSAFATAATWHRPDATPGTGGASGASGSGLSTAGFFAILTAFLMLAAPIVGRWLRPSIGLALQPAFASLPERPG